MECLLVIFTISHSWIVHHKINPCMFYERVIAFVNLNNVTMIVMVLNIPVGIPGGIPSGIYILEEVVPTDT